MVIMHVVNLFQLYQFLGESPTKYLNSIREILLREFIRWVSNATCKALFQMEKKIRRRSGLRAENE